MRRLTLLPLGLLFFSASFSQVRQQVTLGSLLKEMTDLSRLCKRPSPSYTSAQASSYDRGSKQPGNEAWFANGDAGKFLRDENTDGRIEHVMAELRGPGAVVRIWSANPAGTIRFYFDGEAEARFAWPMADLLGGKVKPFADPLAYFSSRGANLYFPFPYARSLKITVDNTQDDAAKHLYYHVGYRTYAPTTLISSLNKSQLDGETKEIALQIEALREQPEMNLSSAKKISPLFIEAPIYEARGSGVINSFRIRVRPHARAVPDLDLPWDHPMHLHNAVRQLRLTADFDGERCIDVPLADFFASAGGAIPFRTQPIEVDASGWMTCRFWMPYRKSARLALSQLSGPQLDVEFECAVERLNFDDATYLFHAQWLGDRLRSRPMRDMEFLNARGEGAFVGTSLHIANPTAAWWGEGDEKIYVDGETFPSTFGTGTEDYFGYAWCDPTPFHRPYHAQPRCDGPGNRGHTNVARFQTFDTIPYRTDLRFDIELWHWADVDVDFDRVVYWYARPGGTLPKPIENHKSLWLTHIPKPPPIKGAVEGETAPMSKTGGITENQGFGELSNGQQLWWRDAKDGDRLVLKIPVKEDGDYEVSGNFCFARDYGIHKLSLGGSILREAFDFYSPSLEWKVVPLGKLRLKAGDAEFVAECLGHRAAAVPRNMLGIDYLMLKKVG